MYLRSIEMKGFKSFPERARLEFSPGVSVIVGPNGSGKSNITDAVLWALGEQSPGAIRGASMQDVISAGGKGVGRRRAAEVEVVIDNSEGRAATEFNEVVDPAHARSLRRRWLPAERRPLPPRRRRRGPLRHQPRARDALGDQPGPGREDRPLEAARAPAAGRGGRRPRQAPQAPPPGRAETAQRRRQPRPRPRPRARGAGAAAPAEAPGAGGRAGRQDREARSWDCKGRLVAEELRFGEDRALAAEKAAEKAGPSAPGSSKALAEVSEQRRDAEERFAARDRERTRAWGMLTKLRGEQQRIGVLASTLADREAEIGRRLETLRAELGPLTLDVGGDAEPGERVRKLEDELGEIEAGLGAAGEGLARARSDDASETARESALGAVRSGAERAVRHARRAEGLLGERHREALRKRLTDGEGAARRGPRPRRPTPPPSRPRSAPASSAPRARSSAVRVTSDEIAEEMRACSQREFEIQAELKTASDTLTAAEVEAAQLGDRRAEAAKELAAIAERLEEEVGRRRAAAERGGAERDRSQARAPRAAPGPDRPGQPAGRAGVRGGARARRGPPGPARGHRARHARAGGADPRHRPRDRARLRGDLRGDLQELRGDGRAPLPGRPREAAAGQPAPGPRSRGGTPERAESAVGEVGEELDDEEDEQREELGVEIEVTPAGKSTRKLSLLSGGEKSLVALAFVFAVFLARPCPFYILDEVEAALDDANIDRFLQLVRRFSDRAQFVIVTHQKRTMDAADVLYGVTMGDDGVTKVVSRRLPREEEGAGALEAEAEAGPPPFAGIPAEDPAEADEAPRDRRSSRPRGRLPARPKPPRHASLS